MSSWSEIDAVWRMQEHLHQYAPDPEYDVRAMCAALGYSIRHASRLFKTLVGRTPADYLRTLRLTDSAIRLHASDATVLDVAVGAAYQSHAGFTRAFAQEFGVTPSDYRRNPPPIARYLGQPVRHYFTYLDPTYKENVMTAMSPTCTVTIVDRPARQLLLLRSRTATEYWSFCEERGCEWGTLLSAIEGRLSGTALVTLPEDLVTAGTTSTAAGVEMPDDYPGPVPEGYDVITLPAGPFAFFTTRPYADPDGFNEAIDMLNHAVQTYDPAPFGYRLAPDAGAALNFGAEPSTGARQAHPLTTIR